VILEEECDPAVQIQHQAMSETNSKVMAATLANHNEILLNDITNVIKEAFNLDIHLYRIGVQHILFLLGIGKYLLDKHRETMYLENLQIEVNAATLFSSQCNSRYWTTVNRLQKLLLIA